MNNNFKTELYNIDYPNSLTELVNETLKLLDKKILEYKQFFKINEIDQIKINYFDDINKFREFIYDIRGEKESLPEYAKGTYDKGMINAYIDPKYQLNKINYSSHELFHILYMKYILNSDESKRIVWYDEGMAQFMSGEKAKLNNENNFKQFYYKVKEETKIIPNINEINHGKSFYNDNYNGYDLSYLAVRYLSQIMEYNDFQKLMSQFDNIKQIGDNVVSEMFKYYDNLLENNN